MKSYFATIIMMFVINTCLFAQMSIDFSPKSLKTEMKKLNGEISELHEMAVSEPIARTIKSGKFFYVDNVPEIINAKYIYVGRVNTCRAGGCSLNTYTKSDEPAEYFDYFILFDSNLCVKNVNIYNYQATHGYEVSSTSWLKQFRGYDGSDELISGKNVDAISGATISVDATTFDIEHKTQLLRKIVRNTF